MSNRRALVTGAASGLGRAIALRYLEAGWRVLLTDVNDEALAAAEKDLSRVGIVASRHLDVRDDAEWDRARQWCEDTWGGLDLLVNNAGIAAGGRMDLTTMADWDVVLEINLKSVVRGCRTFLPLFKRQGSGHIVNTASLAGIANAPSMATYNVSKTGVIALSQTLRYELAPYGIGVSVLCPSFVNTNLGASMHSSDPQAIRQAHKMISASKTTTEHVAQKVFQAVEKNKFLILTDVEGQIVYRLKRLAPGLLEKVIIKRWDGIRRKFDAGADRTPTTSTATASAPAGKETA
jgi:NAD(P)-dependent dehydrogenase (short-subunit alcohol dehydrogenase family)